MRLSHFFIDHPRFAAVISIFIVVFGLAAMTILPVAQYPNIVPPTVQITTVYPGASAEVVARTVATPLEQSINGVENMDYISSQSTGNGQLTITVIFKIGSDPNTDLLLTQNRVQDTLSRLPQEVQAQGVQVKKTIEALLLGVHVYSPDGSRSPEYISNYMLKIRDQIARLPGVADFQLFGERDYAMRIWIDPDKAAADDISANDIMSALRAQNAQVSAGVLNAAADHDPRSLSDQCRGTRPPRRRPSSSATSSSSRTTRVASPASATSAASSSARWITAPSRMRTGMRPLPGFPSPPRTRTSCKLEHEIWDTMAELKKSFPPGLDYINIYDPTTFVGQSIHEVIETIFIAIVLVVGVVFLFLQTWRATIIPVVAIPISLVGAFMILSATGNLNQQPVDVRPDPGRGHRGRRRHRRGRERRAQHGEGHVASRGCAQDDGRSLHSAHRHRVDVVRRVRSLGFHQRHFGAVLHSVRGDDLRVDDHLGALSP